MKMYKRYLTLFLFCYTASDMNLFAQSNDLVLGGLQKTRAFGGASVSRMLFDYIRSILPEGATMLELGSGWTSGEFARYYNLFSIEHNPEWVGKYDSNYIYAPIKKNWFDVDILKAKLPEHYDLILVDGPPGNIGRYGFFLNIKLFNTNVPLIFDDVNRPAEYKLLIDVAKYLNRPYQIFEDDAKKKFGVILP